MTAPGSADSTGWALALFRGSVLKQAKLSRITELLDDPVGRTCLDVGADNGVISLLLRRMGGTWTSADLDQRAVTAIRELVGERVYHLEGATMPFPTSRSIRWSWWIAWSTSPTTPGLPGSWRGWSGRVGT